MRILVLHDRSEVSDQIERLLGELQGVVAEAVVCRDTLSARAHLAENLFDLFIVDLTVPFDEKRDAPSFEPIRNLLNELFNYGTLNIPADSIGLTREPEALAQLQTELGAHLMVTLEETTDGSWLNQLADRVLYASRSAEGKLKVLSQHYDVDSLIVTALDEEFAPFENIFDLSPSRHYSGAYEFVYSDKHSVVRRGVIYSIGGSGQAPAASATQSLISWFRPRIALMAGICGGFKDKVRLGDTVIFEAASAWDYGKWREVENSDGKTEEKFFSRPNPISISGKVAHRNARQLVASGLSWGENELKQVRTLSGGKLERAPIVLGQAASGSAVVANQKIVGQIQNLNDSICVVDMESYGFYWAANNTHVRTPEFLCVKSVCDFSNNTKDDDYHEVCCYLSAQVAAVFLRRYADL